MANYTYRQLVDMQSPEKIWEKAGYTKAGWQTDDGQDMWYSQDGENQRTTGQLMEILEEGGFGIDPKSMLPENVMPWGGGDDFSWINQKYGTNFQSGLDYLNYLYGPGGQMIYADPGDPTHAQMPGSGSNYYILPEGKTPANYVNAPLQYDPPDSGLTKWMPAILGSVALAGMGGLLPGTTSIFGGGGAAAGAAAGGASDLTAAQIAEIVAAEGGFSALPSVGMGGLEAGGGSFLDSIIGGLADATKGITTKDLLSGGLNYFLNQKTADDMAAAAGAAGQMGDPLAHPTRQPYQQMLMQLMQNPQSFYETNPVVASQLDQARKQFLANSAKMGVGGTQTAKYFDNMKNVFAGTFNDQANLLSGLGGFGFPGGGGTNAYMQGMTGAAQQGAESYRGLGDIVSKIFGNTSFGNKSVSDIFGLG